MNGVDDVQFDLVSVDDMVPVNATRALAASLLVGAVFWLAALSFLLA